MTTTEILEALLGRFDADSIALSASRDAGTRSADMTAAQACTPRYHWDIHGVSVGLLDTQRALADALRRDGPLDPQVLCDWLHLWAWTIREYAAATALGDGGERRGGERWEVLAHTSPSGKTLFRCQLCGRESVGPDKWCPPGCPSQGEVRDGH